MISLLEWQLLLNYQQFNYLLYLATDKAIRSHGYGGKILQEIKRIYGQRQPLILAIEEPNSHAVNQSQRLRRLSFYQRNGLQVVPGKLIDAGTTYNFMSSAPNFSIRKLKIELLTVTGACVLFSAWLFRKLKD